MQRYLALFRISVRRQMTYRVAMFAGLVTNLFFGLLRAAVLMALYASRHSVEGISIEAAVMYTGLTQAIIAFLSLFSWFDIIASISTGEISSDLLKPIDFYSYWLARDLGRAITHLLFRALPIMVVYGFLFEASYPNTPGHWLVFLVSLMLSWMVSFSWRFLINLAGFWVPNAVGIGRTVFILSWFLSGFLMPLRFFPEWFVKICYLTPFPHTINSVVEIYLGILEPIQVWQTLLGQVYWIICLYVIGKLVLRAGIKKLVIQGG